MIVNTLEIPTIIETERLYLRMPMKNDGILVNSAIKASFDEFKKWLPWAQYIPEPNETEQNLLRAIEKFKNRESLRYLIFKKDTDEFVGVCSFQTIEWKIPKFEIGYWLDVRFVGKGFMTEAVKGLTDVGFDKLNARRIEIRCETENIKSKSIPIRLGYELDGIIRNDDLTADGSKLTDTCIFSKIR